MGLFDKLKDRVTETLTEQASKQAKKTARRSAEAALSAAKAAGRRLEEAVYGARDELPPASTDAAERKRKEEEVGEMLRAAERRVREREKKG